MRRGKAMCRWRQRLKWCFCKQRIPETALYHQELERGQGRCSSRAFRESFALLTLWVWISSLHKNDRMQFCCLKPSSLWSCYGSPRKQIVSSQSNVVTRVLINGRGRQKNPCKHNVIWETWLTTGGLENGGRRPWSREWGQPLEAGNRFSSKASRRNTVLETPWF